MDHGIPGVPVTVQVGHAHLLFVHGDEQIAADREDRAEQQQQSELINNAAGLGAAAKSVSEIGGADGG